MDGLERSLEGRQLTTTNKEQSSFRCNDRNIEIYLTIKSGIGLTIVKEVRNSILAAGRTEKETLWILCRYTCSGQ